LFWVGYLDPVHATTQDGTMGVQRDVFEATVCNLDGSHGSETLHSREQRIASRPIRKKSALQTKETASSSSLAQRMQLPQVAAACVNERRQRQLSGFPYASAQIPQLLELFLYRWIGGYIKSGLTH
jgi:hypothetical protein